MSLPACKILDGVEPFGLSFGHLFFFNNLRFINKIIINFNKYQPELTIFFFIASPTIRSN